MRDPRIFDRFRHTMVNRRPSALTRCGEKLHWKLSLFRPNSCPLAVKWYSAAREYVDEQIKYPSQKFDIWYKLQCMINTTVRGPAREQIKHSPSDKKSDVSYPHIKDMNHKEDFRNATFVNLEQKCFSKPLQSESNWTNQIACFDQPMKFDQSDCLFCSHFKHFGWSRFLSFYLI